MNILKRFKFCIFIITVLIIVLINEYQVNAEIIVVDEVDSGYVAGNKLNLLKEPDIKEFTLTTNLSDGRALTYHKNEENSSTSNNVLFYFLSEDYKTKKPVYKDDYDSKSVTISNVKDTDTIDVYYRNTGFFNEKPIDMRMHISDMHYEKVNTTPDSNIIYFDFCENPYEGYLYNNLSNFNIEYTFYYSDSGEKVNIQGDAFLTFNSLNGADYPGGGEFVNYLNFDTSASNSEVDAYISKDSNVEIIAHTNIFYKLPVYIGISNDFDDYLGGDTFTKNSVSFQMKGTSHRFVVGAGQNIAWNAISSAVLFKVTADNPIKTVTDENGDDINNQIVKVGQKIKYNVEQNVNVLGQDILDKYSSFEIKDNLSEHVEFERAEIIGSNGEIIENPGTINYDETNHSVVFVANDNFLKNVIQYNSQETYCLRIHVKVSQLQADENSKDLLITNKATSTINNTSKVSNTVSNTLKMYKVNVKHIVQKNNEVLKEKNENKYNGETYSYSPEKELKYNEKYNYTPVSLEKINGTISGKDEKFVFYYKVPSLEIGIKKIQIYTDEYSKGLPINISLNKVNISIDTEGELDELKDKSIVLNVIDKSTQIKVFSKTYDLLTMGDELKELIPSKNLKINNNTMYEATIEVAKPEDEEDIIIIDPSIDTKGYTSSEKTLNLNSEYDTNLQYKGVVMTEREIGKEMVVFYEELIIPIVKQESVKTGYGVEMDKIITYSNEINVPMPIKAKIVVDSRLIDSYTKYEEQEKQSLIPLGTTAEHLVESNTLKQTLSLPKVFVEEKTGSLFSHQQKEEGNVNIKHDLKDGGNKLYIPIWLKDLGDYSVKFQNTDPVGVNKINFIISDTIDVYAYMYGHIDSDTIKEDEILIVPVNTKNPFPKGNPNGWSNSDVAWLKK